jgi:hypothetical protein
MKEGRKDGRKKERKESRGVKKKPDRTAVL